MYKDAAHKTIFHEILASNLPDSEKSPSRLWQDGQTTVIAGTLTTASALSYATYYFLTQPDVLKQLRDELRAAIPDPTRLPPLATLEQLPYLRSCIKEALRLSNGVSSRLQRIDPEKPILFTDKVMKKGKVYVLPPGTPISMTGMLMHTDPEVFEAPMVFNPQRWIDRPGLEKYLVPFARGSRQCVGMELAYAELYVALALIFRLYGSKEVTMDGDRGYLELYDTQFARDLEIVGDGITPLTRKESNGLRIRVRAA